MDYFKKLERRKGVDIGYHNFCIHPSNKEGCVGKRGIDKNFKLDKMLELAYKMEEKPNILIKSGKKGKWYIKKFNYDDIDTEIEKQKWRDTSRCIMYIIEWE